MATATRTKRQRIEVQGIVQGVGFRPFVYNLARSLGLTGFVFNSSSGVTIEVEGELSAIDIFLRQLRANPPHLAVIQQLTTVTLEPRSDSSFSIRESHHGSGFSLVPFDVGTCDACWSDFGDSANRRFGYPFTNCTHCGPRYSIIQSVPYDRPRTTMAAFIMCPACAAEYANPGDRRFHAQPNACPVCGPSLELVATGTPLSACSFSNRDSLATIRRARNLLREGNILAVKGLGGFLLACDATNHSAVTELRRRKRRSRKPFALMSRDLASLRTLAHISPADEAALTSPRRPIVVLPRLAAAPISPEVAPGNDTIGVMLPYTPLHYLLFSDSPNEPSEFPALVMTSGNISEEPIVISNEEALRQLAPIADFFLLHNRDIHTRVDDSVVRTFEGQSRVLRRARGFVPDPIDLGHNLTEVLAYGAELKNTFCLTKGRYALLSQHIGDLENFETASFFHETLDRMKALFRVSPQAVAYDLHPGYWSTRLALADPTTPKFGIQHHHAHIASCMAENHLTGPVIGLAFDGTGYGTDGKIWGCEFLVADYTHSRRRAHLRYVPLPGGDAAVRQPWRMALSYLRDAFGSQIPDALLHFAGLSPKDLAIVDRMLTRRINTVDTSSCGRLFDAVAALLGLASEVSFEGEAAIALETLAARAQQSNLSPYAFDLESAEPIQLDLRATIRAIAFDLAAAVPREHIAARFHHTLTAASVELCLRIRKAEALNHICLSGGTFQNHILLVSTVLELRRNGFQVFLHSQVPANDGGISLGQAVIANELFRRGG